MQTEREILNQAKLALESFLEPVPFVKGIELELESDIGGGKRADFIATLRIGNDALKLVGEVKGGLQPRHVHNAILQVKDYCLSFTGESAYPVVVSDYISPRSAEILIDQNVSYFDLAGNCRLCFANVYIEKAGEKPKSTERRGVKSLFGLKSSRMLRLMLNTPVRPWQVKALAVRTELSLGQVSNVRRALLDQQYAVESEAGGIQILQPGDLLADWRKVYKKAVVTQDNHHYYSLLNADEKQQAIKAAIQEASQSGADILLAGLSSARWLAPFAKSSAESFYADKRGFEILKRHLMLEAVSMGPNVIIETPKDEFVFTEAIECAPGLKCSSVIQTYLDLYIAGEREREAAEHIEASILRDTWNGNFKDER